MKNKIAIFLSGSGSNAKNICAFFQNHQSIEVAMLLSNKENSGAKSIGEIYEIPYFIFNKELFYETDVVQNILKENDIDFLILAGFLWLIPNYLLQLYPNKIINIHPALLPKYGGKGMHGIHVHQAVFENAETESGITIHLCNEHYDDGKILFQKNVILNSDDTPEIIAKKVLALEHKYFAKVIELYILAD